MIVSRPLSGWDGLVGLAAILAMMVLALGIMVGAVKRGDASRHILFIAGGAILLTMLPAIIVAQWYAMTFGQHCGIAMILITLIVFKSAAHRKSRKERR